MALTCNPGPLYSTFYPPNLNSTLYITNTTLYGTYDYCFMPHPRLLEYNLPEPVASGSVKANLVYLHYIQRHQRRTAYNILPGGENVKYNCSNIKPFLYAEPGDGVHAQQALRVYAATYTDPANPFDDTYADGTCQYPQLTIGGLMDGYQHGKDLWGVYSRKLGLFPKARPDRSTWFRSSESPLTQGSAGGVLRGIWPHYNKLVPLHQQASAIDTVNQGFSCDLRSTILSAIKSTALWNASLTATASLLASLSGYTQNESAWTSTFDHLEDNFQARLCNGYGLPEPWNHYWRNNPNVTTYIQTVEGLFIGEILDGFARCQNGSSNITYVDDFLHDGDIGAIAGALGITALRWPRYGKQYRFRGLLFACVLYSGQPISTIHGLLDWLPLQALVAILQPFVPGDITALCDS
ncbi:phosphoglycerate mutase-like protein [Teratosphaeria nubilosa]|uniref:Phosphoglycerate mutase-like protein n=1 Tax=Teratosphaeria nubilosa TaxID=161662 RepID=A0A6G1LMT4_9PEZI|nr:phosphoglycerate mutase-like protein [Teratosphaeria nubilosa]